MVSSNTTTTAMTTTATSVTTITATTTSTTADTAISVVSVASSQEVTSSSETLCKDQEPLNRKLAQSHQANASRATSRQIPELTADWKTPLFICNHEP